ncbi:MAG: lipopolysaccharide biosynthesis protein [Clostridiaceae bacterium]
MEKLKKVLSNNKVQTVFKYSLIKYVALAFGFLKGIVMARYLGPELFGVLGNLLLILNYTLYANFGIFNSMNRNYVLYKDKDENKANDVIKTSFTATLFISITFLAIGIGSTFIYKGSLGAYLLLVFIVAITEQYRQFFTNYFRLVDNYRAINNIELINNVLSLGLIVLIIAKFQIYGVLYGMLLSGIFLVGYGIYNYKLRGFKIDYPILKSLIIIGVPLLIYNLGYYIMQTIDRLVIIKYLQYDDLGYYTFASQIVSATLVFVNSILFLYYPKAIKQFNISENKIEEVKKRIISYTKAIEIFCVGLILGGYLVIEPFISIVVPKYQSSVFLFRILILGVVINVLSYFANVYIVSNNKQFYLVKLQVFAIIINFVFDFLMIKLGYELKGIVIANFATNMIYSIVQFTIFSKLTTKVLDIKLIFKTYSKIVLSALVLIVINIFAAGWIYYLAIILVLIIFYAKDFLNLKKIIKTFV